MNSIVKEDLVIMGMEWPVVQSMCT